MSGYHPWKSIEHKSHRGRARGTQREHAVRDWLKARDYVVVRSAGSLGCVDLVAMKPGDLRLIEVKASARGPFHSFGPAKRADLRQTAEWAGGTGWLAWWPPRGKLVWLAESEWPA
jgi:Holliday junction resolvase